MRDLFNSADTFYSTLVVMPKTRREMIDKEF